MPGSIQDDILTYVYQQVPLGKYRYKILKNKDDLMFLKSRPHYVGPNYYGYDNLLVFIKIKNNFYSFFIERNTLTYSKEHLDMSRVIMNKINVYTTADIYNGTILDGILSNKDGKKIYIVTDAYQVAGKSFLNIEYKVKMQQLKDIVSTKIKKNKHTDNIDFYVDNVKTYIDLDAMTDISNNKINCLNNLSARGLIFYPPISGNKFIFTINNNNKKNQYNKKLSNSESESSDDESSDSDDEKKASLKNDEEKKTNYGQPIDTEGVFLMKQTSISDVYDLFLNKNKLKVKIGIAYVSGINSSKAYKKFFSDGNDKIRVECTWNQRFNKWQPKEITDEDIDDIAKLYD
jgi:hypothetical protein